jgi:hypothetical protein
MARKIAVFPSEAALCAAFIAWIDRDVNRKRRLWTPYAETAGWDILLVADDGSQIGVQAKLQFNMRVLAQTIPEVWMSWHDIGPDFRAVLVPAADSDAARICGALGITLIAPYRARGPDAAFDADLGFRAWTDPWHCWFPGSRCALPAYVPDVPAGASGPVQLSTWKIAALRIVATLDVRGYVTRADFKQHRLDARRWTGPGGWLIPGDQPGRYVRGNALRFEQQHPSVYAQVRAEIAAALARVERIDGPG